MKPFHSKFDAEYWFAAQQGASGAFSCLVFGKPTTLCAFGTLGLIDVESPSCQFVPLPFVDRDYGPWFPNIYSRKLEEESPMERDRRQQV